MVNVTHILYIEDLPAECIADCSASGDVSEAVIHWAEKLNFTVDIERAKRYLKSTGGWTATELEDSTVAEITERVLWLACCDFNEGSDIFCLEA